jgi:MFS family permease
MFIKRRGYFGQVDKLGIIALISTIAFAAVGTIWSVYAESFIHNPAYVGFLMSFFTIVSLLSFIFLTPIVEKKSKTWLYTLSLIVYFFSYILFSLISSIYALVLLGFLIAVVVSLKISSFGILVCDKSNEKKLSRNEGLIYTFFNIGWLVGPLIAGFFSEKYGIKSTFLIASLFILFSLLLFKFFKIRDNRTEKKAEDNLFKLILDFFKNKNRVLAYIVGGGVTFWWVLIYVYMPIHIVESGLNDYILGYFLFAIAIPLILLTYLSGKIAGKIGFRKIFVTGYFILGLCALICFFVTNIYWMMGILVFASVGASMVESTVESYFFDIITKPQRDKFYGIYNTTIEVSSSIASFLSAIILLFFPFNSLFIFFAFGMLFFVLISLSIKNVVESKRK